MNRFNRKGYPKNGVPESTLRQFRRRLHKYPDVRKGLSAARQQVDSSSFPAIIGYLGRQSIYRQVLAPHTFPKSLNDYGKRLRLAKIASLDELLWLAAVFTLYLDQLERYVKLRDSYYDTYLDGGAEDAARALGEIEEEFGQSRWLLSQKFHIIHETEGLQAQKDYLEEVMSSELSQIIAWSSYFFSLRAENNVSFSTLENKLSDLIGHGDLIDYFRHVVISYDPTEISELGVPMSWDEPGCMIDRLETFVMMSQLALARGLSADERRLLADALERLSVIQDWRLLSAHALITGSGSFPDAQIISAIDSYTSGCYEDVISNNSSPIELIARAYATSGIAPPREEGGTVRAHIVSLMYEILIMSPEAAQSRQKLKKIASLTSGHPVAYQITGFLERSHDHVFVTEYTELDKLTALATSINNPWHAVALGQIVDGDWLAHLQNAHPNSPTLRLRSCVIVGDEQPLLDGVLDLPPHRQSIYMGHVALKSQRFDDAIYHYTEVAKSEIEYIAASGLRYLYRAFIAAGRIKDAVKLAVSHVRRNPGAAQAYPLTELARLGLRDASLRQSMSLAILLHLAARHEDPEVERDLSDVYENVLGAYGYERPSQLIDSVDETNKEDFIYFLRYVCVPRILDGTTQFRSVDEIEAERISICQKLLVLDARTEATYLDEIRALTLESRVALLLHQVQTSKIYVDEVGVRRAVEPTLRDSFARFQQLLGSPNLSYQAEKLSKRLEELLSSLGYSEFKGLKLPASEAESLFAEMLLGVVFEFALNPAYGLDTHVSTSIRHGAFEGHLRSPLAAEDLLCQKQGERYVLPHSWEQKLSDIDEGTSAAIVKALGRFTEKFDEFILSYLREKLHIRITGGSRTAMFNFEASAEQNGHLLESTTTSTDYEGFVDKLMNHCWSMTTASLEAIRAELINAALPAFNTGFDTLVRSLTSAAPHEQIAGLLDAIARARTSFQPAIEDVAQWFHRPTDLSREPFEFEVAVHVALKQIENCYVRSKVEAELHINVPHKLDGQVLDGLCEILFILMQNAIIHGGYEAASPSVTLLASLEGNLLQLTCSNSLSDLVDITERRNSAADAMLRYRCDSALKMARKEGGSGLSKIWRIAEFDLRAEHSLHLEVRDEKVFEARLSLEGLISL